MAQTVILKYNYVTQLAHLILYTGSAVAILFKYELHCNPF